MAFRASSVIPATVYDRAKQLAVQLKRLAQDREALFASGGTAAQILSLADNLNSLKASLDAIKSTPGIAAYASSQENDGTYDVAAEFTAMLAAADAVIAEIVAAIPKDGSGWLLIHQINADGTLTPRTFTGPQLATLRTRLNELAASVA